MYRITGDTSLGDIAQAALNDEGAQKVLKKALKTGLPAICFACLQRRQDYLDLCNSHRNQYGIKKDIDGFESLTYPHRNVTVYQCCLSFEPDQV